jgi:hypothetical protein
MRFSNIITYLTLGATLAIAASTPEEAEAEASTSLPGLNTLQTKYATAIISKAKSSDFGQYGRQACEAAIATTLVEV